MRVLFTTNHGSGHWHPLVPFAHALEAAGHEVAFAAAPMPCAAIAALGFRCFAVGQDETAEETQERMRRVATLPGEELAAWAWANLFAGSWAAARLPDLLTLAAEWQPAVLVREDMEFAGCIAAERLGLPHAAVQVTAWRPWLRPVLVVPLNRLRVDAALPPDRDLTTLNHYLLVVPSPPRYCDPAFPLPTTARHVRHVAFDRSGEEALPTWVDGLPDRPIIYATMGTYFNRVPGVHAAILDALYDEPVTLILTVGRDRDPADFGPQPSHVRVERYVPQSLLFPRCAAAVHHGGSGTVLTSLAHGLPMVVIPVSADQPDNALRCEQLGVANVVSPQDRTPEVIRDAVREVLRNPDYRRNAERLREEMQALPGPELVVGWLEWLATEQQPLVPTL